MVTSSERAHVTSDEFPFVAKIIYDGNQVGGTGSLIAPNKVLTAGHCVSGHSNISVGFGNLRSVGMRSAATRIVVHPDIDPPNFWENDIAVIEFDPPETTIQPVRLLTLDEEFQYDPSGTHGLAVGWGRTDPGDSASLPETLQKVDVPVYTKEDCKQILGDLSTQGKHPRAPTIHEKLLCAGQENQAIGDGDSGGPLLVEIPDGWAQIGVLSQSTRNPAGTIVYMGAIHPDILLLQLDIPRSLVES